MSYVKQIIRQSSMVTTVIAKFKKGVKQSNKGVCSPLLIKDYNVPKPCIGLLMIFCLRIVRVQSYKRAIIIGDLRHSVLSRLTQPSQGPWIFLSGWICLRASETSYAWLVS